MPLALLVAEPRSERAVMPGTTAATFRSHGVFQARLRDVHHALSSRGCSAPVTQPPTPENYYEIDRCLGGTC